jgi:hypothetical protein
MENLDLDIHNYSTEDLKTFFQLNKKRLFTVGDIETKEYEIREMLLKSGQVDRRFKSDLITFLSQAKSRLIALLTPPIQPPTTIPKNQKLDPYDYPASAKVPPRTDELNTHPDALFIYSQPSEFFQGNMNPLSTRILTQCMNIDTRFRENLDKTQSSDFTIQLPTKFNKVVSMQLSALEFPVDFYSISAKYGNNFLYLGVVFQDIVDPSLNKTTHDIFIVPDGNYTTNDLVETLNNLICPLDSSGNVKYPDDIFSYIQFKLDENASGSGSRKLTIESTGPYASNIKSLILDFTKDIDGNEDLIVPSIKIGWNLGFTKYKYSGQSQYTAETVMDVNTFRYVYLAVDDFQKTANNYFTTVFGESILTPDILARISTKGMANDIGVKGDIRVVTEPRKYFGPVDIQRLRIRLYDAYGRIVPMNGVNYSFCLTLKMIYDL